jgi:hypothetical protein
MLHYIRLLDVFKDPFWIEWTQPLLSIYQDGNKV